MTAEGTAVVSMSRRYHSAKSRGLQYIKQTSKPHTAEQLLIRRDHMTRQRQAGWRKPNQWSAKINRTGNCSYGKDTSKKKKEIEQKCKIQQPFTKVKHES